MKKQDLILSISGDANYKGSEVKELINSISKEITKPFNLREGDVFLSNIGRKRRPAVVVSVTNDLVFAIPLTTTEDVLSIGRYDSRFLGSGSFAKQIITVPFEYALDNFIAILDDSEGLNEAYNQIKEFYNKNLK